MVLGTDVHTPKSSPRPTRYLSDDDERHLRTAFETAIIALRYTDADEVLQTLRPSGSGPGGLPAWGVVLTVGPDATVALDERQGQHFARLQRNAKTRGGV